MKAHLALCVVAMLASSAFTMNPAVRKLPYDSLKAFDWVAMLGFGPTLLTVGPALQVSTVKELVAAAKARPGQLTMASAGGFQHFAHALFRSLSGTDMMKWAKVAKAAGMHTE